MRWYYHHEYLGSHPFTLMTQHKNWNGNHFDYSEFGYVAIRNRISRLFSFTIDRPLWDRPPIKPEDIFSWWRSRVRFLLNQSGAIKNVENDINRCLYDRNLVWWSAPEVKATSALFAFTIWKCFKPEIILQKLFYVCNLSKMLCRSKT